MHLPRRTPVIRAGDLLLKLENLQRTGSFKLRGALARVRAMSEAERARGVVSASAGNHGAGLALAARALGVSVTVCVPEGTPENKRDRIASLGARVKVRGAGYDDSDALARDLARETGALFVSPFDDDHVIAGNGGDLAEELLEQVPDLSRVAAPVGGGGLIGGMARALAPRGVEVIGVQPAENCAMHDSLRLGRALTEYDGGETLAEGCEGAVAERTYRLCAEHRVAMALVSEGAIRRAVAALYREAGQIVEPSGAVAFAAFREGALLFAGEGRTACIVTGGNAEPALLDEILAGA